MMSVSEKNPWDPTWKYLSRISVKYVSETMLDLPGSVGISTHIFLGGWDSSLEIFESLA